jgi:putative DNA primase/helicase
LSSRNPKGDGEMSEAKKAFGANAQQTAQGNALDYEHGHRAHEAFCREQAQGQDALLHGGACGNCQPAEPARVRYVLKDFCHYGQNGRAKFEFGNFGDYIIENHHIIKLNNALHIYDNGVYKLDNGKIHELMTRLMPTLTRNQQSNVYSYLRYASPKFLSAEEARLTAFNNGVLDWDTGKLLPFSPRNVLTQKIAVNYKPDAKPDKALRDVVFQILDENEVLVDCFLQYLVYCMSPYNDLKKFLLIHSRTNCGKSTLLNIVAQLFGKESTCFLDLNQMGKRFMKVRMHGKLIKIDDELQACDMDGEAERSLNAVVSAAELEADHKGKDPFVCKSNAKLLLACNQMPKTNDEALKERILFMPLHRRFIVDGSERAVNRELKEKKWSAAALEDLARLSVSAYMDMRANGKKEFKEAAVQKAAKSKHFMMANPIVAFLGQMSCPLEGSTISETYGTYEKWCDEYGIDPIDVRAFSRIVQNGRGVATVRKRVNGQRRERYFMSIFNDSEQEDLGKKQSETKR